MFKQIFYVFTWKLISDEYHICMDWFKNCLRLSIAWNNVEIVSSTLLNWMDWLRHFQEQEPWIRERERESVCGFVCVAFAYSYIVLIAWNHSSFPIFVCFHVWVYVCAAQFAHELSCAWHWVDEGTFSVGSANLWFGAASSCQCTTRCDKLSLHPVCREQSNWRHVWSYRR